MAKIIECGPLGIKATLASAHLALGASQAEAFSNLNAQYTALYGTEDFKEGRRAEAEGRPPVYHGRARFSATVAMAARSAPSVTTPGGAAVGPTDATSQGQKFEQTVAKPVFWQVKPCRLIQV